MEIPQHLRTFYKYLQSWRKMFSLFQFWKLVVASWWTFVSPQQPRQDFSLSLYRTLLLKARKNSKISIRKDFIGETKDNQRKRKRFRRCYPWYGPDHSLQSKSNTTSTSNESRTNNNLIINSFVACLLRNKLFIIYIKRNIRRRVTGINLWLAFQK